MNFTPKNKIDTGFSVVSLLNLIFLLAVFFMLTSSFITPSGLPVNLPSSQQATVQFQKVSVTITKDLVYYVGDKKVTRGTLEGELKSRLVGEGGSVVLFVDKSVPAQQLVDIASMAIKLEAKVVIGTTPE
jgi:biopolymer transport protein ExbD